MARASFRGSLTFACVVPFVLVACGGGEKTQSVHLHVAANASAASSVDGPAGSHLDVPAGASSTDVTIVLSAPSGRRSPPAGTTVVATPLRLEPEGQTFDKALELTIPITPSSLPAGRTIDEVVVVRAPQGSDAFVPIPTRRNGSAVVAQTEHFSDFLAVVFDGDAGRPFGGCVDRICAPTESCSTCPYDCGLCLPSSDTTPPSVSIASPGPSAVGVAGDAPIDLLFDEALLASSISSITIEVRDDVGPVLGSFTTPSPEDVVFVPSTLLKPNTVHTITVSGVRDTAGNLMTTPYTSTFTTAAVATVASSSPAQGATNVAQTTNVSLTLSQPVRAASIAAQSDDGPCSGTVQISADGFTTCLGAAVVAPIGPTTIDLAPKYPLPGVATISVRFAKGAVDAGGYPLDVLPSVSFTIETDVTPPQVRAISPADLATGALPSSTVIVSFDEPVDLASVSTSTIEVSNGEVPYDGTYTSVGRTIVFTPSAALPLESTVYVTVAGVQDLHGNLMMATSFTSTFQTAAYTHVATSSPVDGAVGVHPRQDLVLAFTRDIVPGTFTMQATDGPCSGSVQVSDGTSCYGGTVTATASPGSITIRPTSSLASLSSISIVIDATAMDGAGYPFAGQSELNFRVSPTSTAAYVIADTQWLAGNLGGIAGADMLCDPTGAGRKKAFLMSSARRACSTPNCQGGVDPLDWVLQANTTYVTAAGDLLFVTDATAPIFTGWPMAQYYEAGMNVNFLWGGTSVWVPAGADCLGWTAGDSVNANAVGNKNAYDASWLMGGSLPCDQARPLLCVEQPPAQAPAVH